MADDTPRPPDFFIVGQPKTGTTALHALLPCHPEIYMPDLKEPHYFVDELADDPRPTGLPTTLDQYLALFASAVPGQVTGEVSTLNLWSRTAAHNIARLRPDARVIMTFREPASFLHSLHLQLLRIRTETEQDLQRALALEPERRSGHHLPHGGYWPQLVLYSEHMAYMAQLRRYRDAFSDDQLLVLIYDDFRDDYQATVRAILRFLEVDETVSLPTLKANQSVRVRSRRAETLVDTVSSGRGRSLSILKSAIVAVTPQSLRRGAQSAILDHIAYTKPPGPDPVLMRTLRYNTRLKSRHWVTISGAISYDCGATRTLASPDLALTVRAPDGPGRGKVRLGLENWGCRSPYSRAQEDHLGGAARWPQFHGRGRVGRRRFGLARGYRVVGAGG